jgi:copper(I)-binding protein
MKTFSQYLTESKKTFKFKVKVAADLSDEQVSAIERGLQMFKLLDISKPKRLPIQENPVNFETLGPVEVSLMEVETAYPATIDQIKQVVHTAGKVAASHVFVNTESQEIDVVRISTDKDGKPLLLQDYEDSDEKVQELYGDENVKITLKSLENGKKKYEFELPNKETAKSSNDLPQGVLSPVGSKQNKIPDPMKRK